MREIEKWVTVKGNRIPIFKGENVKAKFAEMYRQRYINNWKKQEVDRTLDYYENLNEEWEKMQPQIEELKSKLNLYRLESWYRGDIDDYFLHTQNLSDEEKQKLKELYYNYKKFMDGKKGAMDFLQKYRELDKSNVPPLDKDELIKSIYKSELGEYKVDLPNSYTTFYSSNTLHDYTKQGLIDKINGKDEDGKSFNYIVVDRSNLPVIFNKEKARPEIQKAVDRHFDELQNKVAKKIGKIKSIYHRGGDDYEFTGTEGKCAVEVILAGGYNIQKLHTRWIVRNSLD